MFIGWDVSTSVIGITVLDETGKFITSEYIDLRKLDTETLLPKMEEAEEEVRNFICKHAKSVTEPMRHFIEDRLGNFSGGRTSLQVLMKLAAFNAVVSHFVNKYSPAGSSVNYLHPSSVKAIMKVEGLVIPKGSDKKALTLEYVSKREPAFPVPKNRNDKPQPYCYDMADSFIVARAGFIKSNETRAKAAIAPKRAARRGKAEG